jgi:hypothetical protein
MDDRFDYGEERIVTLGMGRTNLLYVATTEPDEETTRIVSVRRAELYEIEKYGLSRS